MKEIKITLTVLISTVINSIAQIPNNGFENWMSVGNSLEPVNWYSMYSLIDSSGTYCPVTKSTDHYPVSVGNYSVKITNDTALWNSGAGLGSFLGWGILLSAKLNDKPLFPVTGHPKSLCGYYKFFPQNGDTMNIRFHLYKSGIEITNGNFQSNIAAATWTPFKVYVTDTLYASADSGRISLSASNEPKDGSKPRGNSVLYADNLSFDNFITAVSEIRETNKVSVYPNPASKDLTIELSDNTGKLVSLKIFNVFGQQVFIQGPENISLSETFNISQLPEGFYLLRATTDEQIVYLKKILIVR